MPRTVIFDFGGVLIDWNPRHLYRKLFAVPPGQDDAAMEDFLATVCNSAWNIQQDGGRPIAAATRELTLAYPRHAELIAAFYGRFDEMMQGPIEGTVTILAELRERGVPLYGLTNFSAETYPLALARFPFIGWFQGVIVSGEHRIVKPDPAIYSLLIDRFAIDPSSAVFIDDLKRNAEGAEAVGIKGIHFTSPAALRAKLVRLGLLPG